MQAALIIISQQDSEGRGEGGGKEVKEGSICLINPSGETPSRGAASEN